MKETPLNPPTPQNHRVLFRLGLLLLVTHHPVGYGGLAAAGVVAAVLHDRRWLLLGGACYLVSWLMFGLGLFLAGRTGLDRVRHSLRRRRRLQVLRAIRAQRATRRCHPPASQDAAASAPDEPMR